MRNLCKVLVVLAVLAILATPAFAQERPRPGFGGFGGGGQVFLLQQKSVQAELKLTDEQIKKVAEIKTPNPRDFQNVPREEIRKKMEEAAKANEKAVADILKPEQAKRLKQISLQQQGAQALNDAEVAKAVNLTDEQKQKIQAIQEDSFKTMRELFQPGGGGFNEETRKKMEDLRKTSNEKVMNLLTAEQKTKLKELTGEPFTGKIEPPRRPGGGQ